MSVQRARSVRGAQVLITGANRGMGRLFARQAAHEGASRVVLWGRDAAGLEAVAAEVRAIDATVEVEIGVADLADFLAVDELAAELLETGRAPDVLINNAGMVSSNTMTWEQDPDEAIRTLSVNTVAPIRLSARLLPAMIADAPRQKRILNIASASALTPVPRAAAYAGSKAALAHWSDTLRAELVLAGHAHVAVTTYNPAYVDTGMFAGTTAVGLTPHLSPERAVEIGWQAMLAGRAEVVAPAAVAIARGARALLPAAAFDALARSLGVYSSMDTFTGRV